MINKAFGFFSQICLLGLCIMLLLSSCDQLQFNQPVTENVLARVGNKYLYESDVISLVPKGTSAEDSLSIVRNYINNWVRNQVVVQKAESQLSDDQTSFEQQLEEYRNSLLVYHYQTRLLEQELDTLVTEMEIEQYYNENKSNFELKDHIVKLAFCKMMEDSVKPIREMRKILKADSLDVEAFEKYAAHHAVEFFYELDNWLYFSDIQMMLPLQTFDQEHYLRNNNFIEIQDAPLVYLIRFFDYEIKDGISPLSLEIDNIRNVIINKRKVQFIKKLQQDIFNEAMQTNEIEIY